MIFVIWNAYQTNPKLISLDTSFAFLGLCGFYSQRIWAHLSEIFAIFESFFHIKINIFAMF